MAWYADTDFTKRRKLTIASSAVSAALTNYPAYVDLRECGDVLENIRPDALDLIFTGSDETTLLDFEIVRQKVIGRGATTWFSNPRSIYSATYGKTLVALVAGGNSNAQFGSGDIVCMCYDHATRTTTSFVLDDAVTDSDDHDNASFVELPSGKFMAAWSRHNGDGVYFRKTTSAGDISAWDATAGVAVRTVAETFSYANLQYLSDEDRVYCFYRKSLDKWHYKYTEDEGATWSSEFDLWDAGAQPYFQCCSNGVDRIDFFTDLNHPTGESSANKLFHFYMEGGSLFTSIGGSLTAPATYLTATSVYDGTAGGNSNCWVSDIQYQTNGEPHVVFARFVSGSEQTDHRLMYSKWNGSAWTTAVEIASVGASLYVTEPNYFGGICFDGNDPDVVYLSKVETTHEIQKWGTSDGGATWAKISDITSGSDSGQKNFRPFSPKGYPASSPYQVFYSSGYYTTFTNYDCYLCGGPGNPMEAYVKVPSVSDSAGTDFYLYYDKAAQTTDLSDPTNVWDADFKTVMHMNHVPARVKLYDSTSNAIDATKDGSGIVEPQMMPGLKGGAVRFTGSPAAGRLTLGTALNMAGWTGVTIEALVNLTSGGSAERCVFSNNSTTVAAALFRIEPTSSPPHQLEAFVTREANTQIGGTCGAASAVPTGQLAHIGMTFDSSTLIGYSGGTPGGTTFAGASAMDAGTSVEAFIGCQNATTDGFVGDIEEIRISDVGRSAAWVALTAATYEDWDSVFTVGTEEEQGVGGGGFQAVWARGSNVMIGMSA